MVLENDRIKVISADPVIQISATLLEMIREGRPWVRDAVLDGDLLRIEAVNRTLIYRIGEQVPDRYAYYAEWPD